MITEPSLPSIDILKQGGSICLNHYVETDKEKVELLYRKNVSQCPELINDDQKLPEIDGTVLTVEQNVKEVVEAFGLSKGTEMAALKECQIEFQMSDAVCESAAVSMQTCKHYEILTNFLVYYLTILFVV